MPSRSSLAPQPSSPSTRSRLSRAAPGIAVVMTVHPQSAVAGEETTVAANHEIVRDPPNQTLGCVLFRERARPASRGKTAHS